MQLADLQCVSFVFAPDEHIDIRLFDFYDRLPQSLLSDPIGRAAARRALDWYGSTPTDAPDFLTLPRLQFLKCLEAVGATLLLPSLMGADAPLKMSQFSLVVSPFAREVSFAAMRARLVTSAVVRVEPKLLEPIRVARTIIELGASTIIAAVEKYPEDFVNKIRIKLKGTGMGNYRVEEPLASKIVDWCSDQCISELRNAH
jgi:hypothetical protein